jgi:hypothetical protein
VSVDYLNKPKEIFNEIGNVYCILGASATYPCLTDAFPRRHSRFGYVRMIWNIFSSLVHSFIILISFMPAKCDDISPNPGRSDPMYVVWATKK